MDRSSVARRALRNRLAFRLGVGLCVGSALILLAAGAWNLRLQRRHLTSLLEAHAAHTAEVISGATREAMLRNDPSEVRAILRSIASRPDFERIRVFDKQGRIQVSSAPEEIGRRVDITAEQCLSCHLAEDTLTEPLRDDRTRFFDDPGRGRLMGVISPIRNEASCAGAGCHVSTDEQSVLGVLDVQLSLAGIDRDLAASQRQMLLALGVMVAAVVLLALWRLWRQVLLPVQRLSEGTARVAAGDLSSRIPVRSEDELGALTEEWNAMVGRLAEARGKLEEWNRTLEARVEEKTRELEETHQQMMLVEKMASLGKLSAVVAHEINNPLAGIATYARLLRRRAEASQAVAGSTADEATAESARILELVEGEAERCGRIVRNLLLFSRTPGTCFTPQPLAPLVERCAMLLGHQAELDGIELRQEVAADLPLIECDASQIQQVILALTSNALEACEAGCTVLVAAERSPQVEEIVLRVEDDGRGIAPELVDRIFEPFFTTKEATSGVGLGLAVVYGIVQRHHGTTRVESELGRGARFIVRLPIRQPAEARPGGAG
jgi:two-component system NtrC family sensor kinase